MLHDCPLSCSIFSSGHVQEHRLQLRALMEAVVDCVRFPADAPPHLANGGGEAGAATAAAASEAQVGVVICELSAQNSLS